ncbi:DUF1707 domain-containing protein [Streptomyces collinus]|uniref:Cell wall-active antibiotics response LiaF-like C-terminal domain-containing protein n=2 Tax=Streptomyces TaxID=1883 RepID=A0AA89Q361_STRCU|nr:MULTISPECIES: DUF1707 domain-containing protein [Streptomyces]MBB5813562.1 hypothetical protein [Streptomyces collinus]MEC7056439.1 DUF1707 domain-containing protein [Streptomyces violaceochromogenes]WMX66640.1 DUF1707 domain-containing protein [Streptomyces collinus]GHC67127.1 hypothetical protein GCM10010309_31780 [Streptomyces violaceochromogenes]
MDLQKQDLQQQSAPAVSELRASDAERDRIADILHDALAEGRLTADEHAERVEGVLRAKTVGELEVFIRDLPAAHRQGPGSSPAPAPHRPTAGAIPIDPDDNVVAVFSGAVRKGRWRAGRRIHAYAVFGSVEIDLSEALFDHQQVVVKSFAIFGSVEIRVPENVSLRGTGSGVLGSFEVDTLDSGDPQAPIVYVDGWAVLGSIEARPKRGKVVADILDRVQRKVDRSLRKHLGH